MNNASAKSLTAYINGRGTRFTAETQDFNEKTWVLIRDATAAPTDLSIEPILYLQAYLDREDRTEPLTAEFRSLLENWLEA